MEELLMLAGVVAKTTAVAGAGWAAWRWVRYKGYETERAFQDQMTRDVAELLCQHLPPSREQLEAALRAKLERGEDSPLLDRVLRVECLFARASKATVYSRKVSVLIRDHDDVLILESTRDLPWERLPHHIRGDFIHSGSGARAYVILDRSSPPAGTGATDSEESSAGVRLGATTMGDRPRRDRE
jgi:hypothetical protein